MVDGSLGANLAQDIGRVRTGRVDGGLSALWEDWAARTCGRVAIACVGFPPVRLPALADTLDGALIQAYQNNPTLNAQRASVRATDESVPQALSGYRPRASVNGTVGTQYCGHDHAYSDVRVNLHAARSGNMTP